jgi:hypothetical protein
MMPSICTGGSPSVLWFCTPAIDRITDRVDPVGRFARARLLLENCQNRSFSTCMFFGRALPEKLP